MNAPNNPLNHPLSNHSSNRLNQDSQNASQDLLQGSSQSSSIDTLADTLLANLHKINWQAPWLMSIHPELRDKTAYISNRHSSQSSTLAHQLNKIYHNLSTSPSQTTTATATTTTTNETINTTTNTTTFIATGHGNPLKFIPQSEFDQLNAASATPTTTSTIAYEIHIANTGNIPTRDNLHDLFNAWIWLTYPKTKAMLNRHQAEQIAQDGISGSRGRVRDAITVFDENGAVLITSDTNIANALKAFDWQHCLVQPRNTWDNPNLSLATNQPATQQTTRRETKPSTSDSIVSATVSSMVMVFGHALLEQLVEPRKPLCAHTFILQVEPEFFQLSMEERVKIVDIQLASQIDHWLKQADVSPRQLSPLPILGVPHFWAENSDPNFYDDAYVFRSGRQNDNKKHKSKQSTVNTKSEK